MKEENETIKNPQYEKLFEQAPFTAILSLLSLGMIKENIDLDFRGQSKVNFFKVTFDPQREDLIDPTHIVYYHTVCHIFYRYIFSPLYLN